jgi:hypothetical protein
LEADQGPLLNPASAKIIEDTKYKKTWDLIFPAFAQKPSNIKFIVFAFDEVVFEWELAQ